jgi:hypothetical protein
MKTAKTLSARTRIVWTNGAFDRWMVQVERDGILKPPPSDAHLLTRLRAVGLRRGRHQTLKAMRRLVDAVSAKVDSFETWQTPDVFESAVDELLYWTLAAAMVSEERKMYAVAGKRIKALAIEQVLQNQLTPTEAAQWSRGKSARIDIIPEYERMRFGND